MAIYKRDRGYEPGVTVKQIQVVVIAEGGECVTGAARAQLRVITTYGMRRSMPNSVLRFIDKRGKGEQGSRCGGGGRGQGTCSFALCINQSMDSGRISQDCLLYELNLIN